MGAGDFSFEKLVVWQEARLLVKNVYELLEKYPKIEQFALCNQIRRAVISIPSNIAEGSSRKSGKEKIHFIEIAYGSLLEVYCQLIISKDLNYITEEDFDSIKDQILKVTKLSSGLKSSIEKSITKE